MFKIHYFSYYFWAPKDAKSSAPLEAGRVRNAPSLKSRDQLLPAFLQASPLGKPRPSPSLLPPRLGATSTARRRLSKRTNRGAGRAKTTAAAANGERETQRPSRLPSLIGRRGARSPQNGGAQQKGGERLVRRRPRRLKGRWSLAPLAVGTEAAPLGEARTRLRPSARRDRDSALHDVGAAPLGGREFPWALPSPTLDPASVFSGRPPIAPT